MRIAQTLGSLHDSGIWLADWACGITLIVITVLTHVLGLVFVRRGALSVWRRTIPHYRPSAVFVTVIALVTLLAASLLGIEATMWAVAYRLVGALPDNRS